MIKNIKKIKAEDVNDGDILYIPHHIIGNYNQDLLGLNDDITGLDIIIIVDDIGCDIDDDFDDDCEWLINGGQMFHCEKNDILYKLGHYSELNEIVESYRNYIY